MLTSASGAGAFDPDPTPEGAAAGERGSWKARVKTSRVFDDPTRQAIRGAIADSGATLISEDWDDAQELVIHYDGAKEDVERYSRAIAAAGPIVFSAEAEPIGEGFGAGPAARGAADAAAMTEDAAERPAMNAAADAPAADGPPAWAVRITYPQDVPGTPALEERMRRALAAVQLPGVELLVADWRGHGFLIRYTGTEDDDDQVIDALSAIGMTNFSWQTEEIENPATYDPQPERWELGFSLASEVTGDDAKTAAVRKALEKVDLDEVELPEADWQKRRLKVRFTGYSWGGWVISRALEGVGAPNDGFSFTEVEEEDG